VPHGDQYPPQRHPGMGVARRQKEYARSLRTVYWVECGKDYRPYSRIIFVRKRAVESSDLARGCPFQLPRTTTLRSIGAMYAHHGSASRADWPGESGRCFFGRNRFSTCPRWRRPVIRIPLRGISPHTLSSWMRRR
jgi:hypothetical protein